MSHQQCCGKLHITVIHLPSETGVVLVDLQYNSHWETNTYNLQLPPFSLLPTCHISSTTFGTMTLSLCKHLLNLSVIHTAPLFSFTSSVWSVSLSFSLFPSLWHNVLQQIQIAMSIFRYGNGIQQRFLFILKPHFDVTAGKLNILSFSLYNYWYLKVIHFTRLLSNSPSEPCSLTLLICINII